MKKGKKKIREPGVRHPEAKSGLGGDNNRFYSILILIVLPLIYFSPYFLDPNRMIFGTDWIPTGGYARMFWQRAYFLEHLTCPKWIPYLFGGFSSITAYGDTFFYPLNLITTILPTNLQRVLLFTVHSSIGGIGLFFFLQLLGCGVYSALFAGVVYEFSGVIMTTTYAGHLGRMAAASLLPISFYFLLQALKRRSMAPFFLFGGVVGLHLLGGHFQMSYLALVSMFIFTLYYLFGWLKEGWKERARLVVYFGLSVVFASALTAVKYLPPYSALGQGARGVERGYEYATSWSLPVGEVMDLLVPNFSGVLDGYWGVNYFKLSNEYFGVISLVLAIVTVVVLWRRRWVKFFTFYTLLFLLFSFGGNTPFYRIPYHVIPLLTKFRAPAMLFFMASFGMIVLAGIGLGAITSDGRVKEEMSRAIGLVAVLLFFGSLLLTLFGDSIVGLIGGYAGKAIEASYGTAERVRRLGLLERNLPDMQIRLWIAFLISLVLFAGVYLFARGKVTKKQLIVGLIIVTVFDQWSLDRLYLKPSPAHDRYFADDDVVSFLRRDPDVYRVFPIRYRHDKDGLLMLNHIENIGGYGANPPKRFQRFIGAGESVMFNPVNLYQDRGLLDVLNVKYVIVPPLPEDLSGLSKVEKNMVNAYREYLAGFSKVFSGSHSIYLNPSFLPRAYVVHSYQLVEDGDRALDAVLSTDFDHQKSVVLERDPGIEIPENSDRYSRVKIVERDPHKLVCSVDLEDPGILVVSENYHSDWKVRVDGVEREILHANYVLKAVALSSGSHTVEFVYESFPFRIGLMSTMFSFLVLAYLVYGWRKGKF